MKNESFLTGEGTGDITNTKRNDVVIDWQKNKLTNVSITWEDLEASVVTKKGKTAKQILHKSSGIAEGGKLTAIMGSSGAGKSTLMNILARRNLSGIKLAGVTRINGQLGVDQ